MAPRTPHPDTQEDTRSRRLPHRTGQCRRSTCRRATRPGPRAHRRPDPGAGRRTRPRRRVLAGGLPRHAGDTTAHRRTRHGRHRRRPRGRRRAHVPGAGSRHRRGRDRTPRCALGVRGRAGRVDLPETRGVLVRTGRRATDRRSQRLRRAREPRRDPARRGRPGRRRRQRRRELRDPDRPRHRLPCPHHGGSAREVRSGTRAGRRRRRRPPHRGTSPDASANSPAAWAYTWSSITWGHPCSPRRSGPCARSADTSRPG